MERTRFIEHRGHRIVLLDYTHITDRDIALSEIRKSKEFFARQSPDGSLLTLTHVTGARYDRQIMEALRDLAAHNRRYVRAGAVVSDSALHRFAVRTISMVSDRTLKMFAELEPAKDWLIGQAG